MNNLAYILYEKAQYDEAEIWMGRAIALSPKGEYLDTKTRILSRKIPSPFNP
jgi:hypothetical protein